MGSTGFTGSGLQQHRQQWCPVADRAAFCTAWCWDFMVSKDFGDPVRDPGCSCGGDKVNQHTVASRCPNLFAQGPRHWGVLRACRGSLMPQWLSFCLCGRGASQFPLPANAGSRFGCVSRGVALSECAQF